MQLYIYIYIYMQNVINGSSLKNIYLSLKAFFPTVTIFSQLTTM